MLKVSVCDQVVLLQTIHTVSLGYPNYTNLLLVRSPYSSYLWPS
jgi:hypothetical protein